MNGDRSTEVSNKKYVEHSLETNCPKHMENPHFAV